jgi:hypothetical protein
MPADPKPLNLLKTPVDWEPDAREPEYDVVEMVPYTEEAPDA